MKRITLLLPIAAMAGLFFGCGEAPVPNEPAQIEELLDTAWARYRAGNYESSLATFDSVVVVDAFNSEARLGQGFSASQLASYSDAHGALALISILEASTIVKDTLGAVNLTDVNWVDSGYVDTSWYGASKIWIFNLPPNTLLSLFSFSVDYKEANIIGVKDTKIYIKQNLPIASTPDTAVLSYSYAYFHPENLPEVLWYGFAGEALTYLAERGNFPRGICYGLAAYLGNANLVDPVPERVKTSLQLDNTKLAYILAYLYYRQGWYANAVDMLNQVDPTFPYSGWTFTNRTDFTWCFDPDNTPLILNKIEGGL
jgi:hypothetical protein